jgi:hypothetical protein
MAVKIIFNIIFLVILSVLQFAFIPLMPIYLSNLNLILVSLIFILFLFGLNPALWWAAGGGFILDSVSFFPFGSFLFAYFGSAIIIYFLFKHFFTNRSVYSFVALAFFGSLFYTLIFYFYNYFFGLEGDNAVSFLNSVFWLNFMMQIIFNVSFVFVGFYLMNFTTKRFNPVFLGKKYFKFKD